MKRGGGGVKLTPPGKTTLKKPSLIRVKISSLVSQKRNRKDNVHTYCCLFLCHALKPGIQSAGLNHA